jgi:hypothetical protein
MVDAEAPSDLARLCDQAMAACYSATLLAAEAMLADVDILEMYLKPRTKETESIDITKALPLSPFKLTRPWHARSRQPLGGPFQRLEHG